MKRLHVLVFTSLFRTPAEKVRAPFTSEFLRALQPLADVTLICPVPWAPDIGPVRRRPDWHRFASAPPEAVVDGIRVHYVKYPMIPKLSGRLQPWLQARWARAVARRIHARHPVDIVNGRFIYPDGVAASRIARDLGVPWVLTALGTDVNVYMTQPGKREQAVEALRGAAHVSAVSPELADRIAEAGVPRERLSAAVNGIDLERFHPAGPRAALPGGPRPAGERTLLTVARLSVEKGLPVLVEALGRLDARGRCDFRTVMVGEGPERAVLEARIEALGLRDRVFLAGEVPHGDVPDWLRAAQGFCLPSFREGTPNVVIEALATGLPVAATRVGGTPLLIDAHNGLLVEPADPEDLAQALDALMHRDWDGARIRASVAHMSWASEAQRHLHLFSSILGRPLPSGAAASEAR